MSVDLKKIRTRLRSYERKFKKDPEDRDSAGHRFLMGPYYLCLDDLEGAIAHYEWFWSVFSDSSDEPFHALGRVITELRQGKEAEIFGLLKRVHAANPYLLPFILGVKPTEVSGNSNWEDQPYVFGAPEELYVYISEEERTAIKQIWDSSAFADFVEAYNSAKSVLEVEPRGPRRSELIDFCNKLVFQMAQ